MSAGALGGIHLVLTGQSAAAASSSQVWESAFIDSFRCQEEFGEGAGRGDRCTAAHTGL